MKNNLSNLIRDLKQDPKNESLADNVQQVSNQFQDLERLKMPKIKGQNDKTDYKNTKRDN